MLIDIIESHQYDKLRYKKNAPIHISRVWFTRSGYTPWMHGGDRIVRLHGMHTARECRFPTLYQNHWQLRVQMQCVSYTGFIEITGVTFTR